MQLSSGKLMGMRRMADENGVFKMVAADQRPPIKHPIAERLGLPEAPWDQVARVKQEIVRNLQERSSAVLLDPHYGIPAAFDTLSGTKGCVVTLEDSIFKETEEGRYSSDIDDWSVGKIKRMGGDAVKVLAWYRPDASPGNVAFQQDYVKRVGAECTKFVIPFLLELLLYPMMNEESHSQDYLEMQTKRGDQVLASVAEFAKPEYGVDLFKLESPVAAANADGSQAVQDLFDQMGDLAGRPWVMLSAGANKTSFRDVLRHAFKAGASGFLAGRAIWQDAFQAYPQWDEFVSKLQSDGLPYLDEISQLAEDQVRPWRQHPCYGASGAVFHPADHSFRHDYASIKA